jgi:predicted negative regulator of RcsB-dependent stress response
MASHLDLEEQEQIANLKAFWARWGNLITWVLIAVLGSFAAWNGWNWYQREQGAKASALYDEVDAAVAKRDLPTAAGVFKTMQDRFAAAAATEQAALLLAKAQADGGQADAAQATLAWTAEKAGQEAVRTVARLRLAGLLMDAKKHDEALRQLDGATAKDFEALVADRRGDILAAQGKKDEAKAAWQRAWAAMDDKLEYKRLVDAKLTAIGAPPAAASGVGK